MILIADSGSTKTDWRLISPHQSPQSFRTLGMNPYYQSSSDMQKDLQAKLLPQLPHTIEQIYFYGSGCAAEANCELIRNILQELIPQAQIQVTHDLLAAARALCGHQAGIACISGTGSNACFYDGQTINQKPINLGYVLGDEGSGSHLGKLLLMDYLHEDLPSHLQAKFAQTFPVSRDEVMENVYQKPKANRYLASFSHFLHQNLQDPYCQNIVYQSFEAFIKKYVTKISNYQSHSIHFVGSIAFYYQSVLKQVIADQELILGNILENPIDGLTQYHENSNIA